ncbi:hypothetical protein NSA50_08610 [Clostridium sp. DSM 100503]|nr:hypothetical protein [Clostridium sp. DSM 100503]MCR1951114.1 hypothetical protein [Clostridium sp. DSM 100503]
MNKEEKWKAVIENDLRYDGDFFMELKQQKYFVVHLVNLKIQLKKM